MKNLDNRVQELQETKGGEDEMNKRIKIMLIDDHETVRYDLRRILEQEEDMEVVGDYASAQEALPLLGIISPDVVLMDAQMPKMNGIEALKRTGLNYESNVIVLAEPEKTLVAGAADHLLKEVTRAELVQSIREIYQGKHSDDEYIDFGEEAIELIVPPLANAAQLLRFTYRLEERLNDESDYSWASIAHTVGSWHSGTVITVLGRPPALTNLLEKLENMPEVEKVEQESPASAAFFSLPTKSRFVVRSTTSPSKRLCLTLKETCMSVRKPVAVLN